MYSNKTNLDLGVDQCI